MTKLMIVGRRAPGSSRRAALRHLRDVHGKMVVCPPGDAGPMPVDYIQNHVIDGAYPGAGAHGIERDLVTELWFDDLAHLRASTATPYYLTRLKPDEPRFVDDATVAKMIVRPREFLAGGRGIGKVFVFITSEEGDAAERSRQAGIARFLAAPGLVAATENEVLAPPGGQARFVTSVLEGWFATVDAAAAVLGDLDRLLDLAGANRAASFAVVAEQFDRYRLRSLHGCGPTLTT